MSAGVHVMPLLGADSAQLRLMGELMRQRRAEGTWPPPGPAQPPDPAQPAFTALADDHYRLTFPRGVTFELSRVRREHSALVGLLRVRCELQPGMRGGFQRTATLNLENLGSRDQWIRSLIDRTATRSEKDAYVDLDWWALMEYFCERVREADRADQRGVNIDQVPTVESFGSPQITYVISGTIPEGVIAMLAGTYGCGKSSVASRWGFDLGAEGRPTLVLDRENPIVAVRDRFRRLGITSGGLFTYYGGWLGQVPQPNDPRVLEWIASCVIKPLIVVDSLSTFLQDDENSAEVCNRWFSTIAKPAVNAGATLIVLHNDGKSKTARDFRGSSAIGGAVDLAYHVTNTSVDPACLDILQLRPFKLRVGAPGDGGIFHYAGGAFIRQVPRDQQARTTADIDKLRELLRANPGIGAEQFEKLAVAAGLKRQKARDYLRDAEFTGEIRVEVDGAKYKHYLAEEPAEEAE